MPTAKTLAEDVMHDWNATHDDAVGRAQKKADYSANAAAADEAYEAAKARIERVQPLLVEATTDFLKAQIAEVMDGLPAVRVANETPHLSTPPSIAFLQGRKDESGKTRSPHAMAVAMSVSLSSGPGEPSPVTVKGVDSHFEMHTQVGLPATSLFGVAYPFGDDGHTSPGTARLSSLADRGCTAVLASDYGGSIALTVTPEKGGDGSITGFALAFASDAERDKFFTGLKPVIQGGLKDPKVVDRTEIRGRKSPTAGNNNGPTGAN